jgi:phage shock protein C
MAAVAERLYRSRDDRMLAGVAGGLAEILDADPSLVRIVWALLAVFTGGLAILVYIVMAIVVPEAPANWSTPPGGDGSQEAPRSPAAAETTAAPGTNARDARRAARRARRGMSPDSSRASFVAGLALIVVGVFFLIREVVPWFDWNLWWPVGLIFLGGLFLVIALLPGRSAH